MRPGPFCRLLVKKKEKTMKMFRFAKAARSGIGPYIVLVMILTLVGMIGCAPPAASKDPFASTAYGVLGSSAISYKVIKDTFTDMRAQGLVKDETWAEFDILANEFIDQHAKAARAMADYKRGVGPQSAADLAVAGMKTAIEQLKKYYLDKIPKEQQKPLF
jgi:hypothetical protein